MLCYNQDCWIMKCNSSLTRGNIPDIISSVTDDLIRLYAKYYYKMESYGQKVNDIEKSHDFYQQVAILQDSISRTNTKSNINFHAVFLITR